MGVDSAGFVMRTVAALITGEIRTAAHALHARGRMMTFIDRLDDRTVAAWNKAGLNSDARKALKSIQRPFKRNPGFKHYQYESLFISYFEKALANGASPRQVWDAAAKNPAFQQLIQEHVNKIREVDRCVGSPSFNNPREAERTVKEEILNMIALAALKRNPAKLYPAVELANSTWVNMLWILSPLIPQNAHLAALGQQIKGNETIQDNTITEISALLEKEMPQIKTLLDRMTENLTPFDRFFFEEIIMGAWEMKNPELVAAMAYARAERLRNISMAPPAI